MQEIFEEYGDFIIEAVSSFLFISVISVFFFSSPMGELLARYIGSVVGGS